jgi:hypothetical protein
MALSTAGVFVKYCQEATAGMRPTTGYTPIAGIKSTPDINPEPSQLDTTDLSATEYRTYTPGLKDLSVASFVANDTDDFDTAWGTLVSTYASAAAAGKAIWFEVGHTGRTKSTFFTGIPSALGESSHEVDGVLEINAYVTITKMEGRATASA